MTEQHTDACKRLCICGCKTLISATSTMVKGHWRRVPEVVRRGTTHPCECGCGQVTSGKARFVPGHYVSENRKPYVDPESIDLGVCKCGCGTPIPYSYKAYVKYRAGTPTQYIRGHVSRTPGFPKPPVNRGPDNNKWSGGGRRRKQLLIINDVAASVAAEFTCGCGCGWITLLPANEPDPSFAHGHHLYVMKPQPADYSGLHGWLRSNYEKHNICEKCGNNVLTTDFSLIHGREYTRNRADYRELCKKCHMIYDRPRMKHVSLDVQRNIIDRYKYGNSFTTNTQTIKHLSHEFNVSFGYVRCLVTTTRVTS